MSPSIQSPPSLPQSAHHLTYTYITPVQIPPNTTGLLQYTSSLFPPLSTVSHRLLHSRGIYQPTHFFSCTTQPTPLPLQDNLFFSPTHVLFPVSPIPQLPSPSPHSQNTHPHPSQTHPSLSLPHFYLPIHVHFTIPPMSHPFPDNPLHIMYLPTPLSMFHPFHYSFPLVTLFPVSRFHFGAGRGGSG